MTQKKGRANGRGGCALNEGEWLSGTSRFDVCVISSEIQTTTGRSALGTAGVLYGEGGRE